MHNELAIDVLINMDKIRETCPILSDNYIDVVAGILLGHLPSKTSSPNKWIDIGVKCGYVMEQFDYCETSATIDAHKSASVMVAEFLLENDFTEEFEALLARMLSSETVKYLSWDTEFIEVVRPRLSGESLKKATMIYHQLSQEPALKTILLVLGTAPARRLCAHVIDSLTEQEKRRTIYRIWKMSQYSFQVNMRTGALRVKDTQGRATATT